jgi:hypothetical protein
VGMVVSRIELGTSKRCMSTNWICRVLQAPSRTSSQSASGGTSILRRTLPRPVRLGPLAWRAGGLVHAGACYAIVLAFVGLRVSRHLLQVTRALLTVTRGPTATTLTTHLVIFDDWSKM